MTLTPDKDGAVARTTTRQRRRKRIAIFAAIVLLSAVVFWWHPWRPQITVVESVNPKDGAAMVWVPAGKFLMGDAISSEAVRIAYSNGGWWGALMMALKATRREAAMLPDATPHTVTLDGYWIYKYEVTVAQYRAFCRATGRLMPEKPYWGWQDTHPIVNVCWADAAAYAQWAGAALPTEAQWEKAARGSDGRKYPWGNVWDENKCARYGSSNSSTHDGTWPVGSFSAGVSPYGAQDMSGNVWEWCSDWYDSTYYETAPKKNPVGSVTGQRRVLRGSSWATYDPDSFSTKYRYSYEPRYSPQNYGFRCVLRSPGP